MYQQISRDELSTVTGGAQPAQDPNAAPQGASPGGPAPAPASGGGCPQLMQLITSFLSALLERLNAGAAPSQSQPQPQPQGGEGQQPA